MNHDWTCGRGRSRHPPVNQTDDQKIAALMRPRQPQTVCLRVCFVTSSFGNPRVKGNPGQTLAAPLTIPRPITRGILLDSS
ncbi:hypothetical protein JTE90_025048 [Oedothorax gibbosus]|uniref:Uncharacterized protein n=1 Tax=Oedothorax gibbosus TaxID=931172 RepID=A0AAV6TRN4_9ARAC|nr:hypothetical protein JTE90_025048 [Oedothorax gibbosus]